MNRFWKTTSRAIRRPKVGEYCHWHTLYRHFNHEWMRYASYWLQHVWVEKHGIDAFGRIWRESQFPEDPLQTYDRHEWNDKESDDVQWPYAITVSGTDVNSYNEVIDVVIDPNANPENVSATINVNGTSDSGYEFANYNLAYVDNAAICYGFCLTPDEIANKFCAVFFAHSSATRGGRTLPKWGIGPIFRKAHGCNVY